MAVDCMGWYRNAHGILWDAIRVYSACIPVDSCSWNKHKTKLNFSGDKMYCDFPIEISGLTTIIFCDVHYERMKNNDWVRLPDCKVTKDAHMWAHVKRAMHKTRLLEQDVRLDHGETVTITSMVPCYRAWACEETLNIEKVYYD